MIEDMRNCYKECEPFLTTTQPLKQSDVVKEAKIEALKSIAKSLLGIDRSKLRLQKKKSLEESNQRRRTKTIRRRA